MVGFIMSENCVRFSEKVIQTMGMEATVNILHGHVLTNTKKERNLQHLTVKLSYRDKSHCLALHCIALLASLRWPHLIL